MTHWFYITPEEYQRAESFGVDAFNLERRVRLLAWDKERAITEPLRSQNDRKAWADLAESNGIKYQTFMNRVLNLGWDEERAATTPVISKKDNIKKTNEKRDKKRVIPTEIVRLAETNGISYQTLRARIKKQGIEPYVAATMSKKSMKEIQEMGKEAYEKVHGRFNKKIFKEKG